jgi:hypothetical protein
MDKVPIFKFGPEEFRYQNSEVAFIVKKYSTLKGAGTEGVWEYCKTVDSTKVFLNIVLIAKSSKSEEKVVIVKKETQIATHEGQSIATFYFGTVKNELNLNYHLEAERILTENGVKNAKILTSSGVCQGYFTDPWKSD